MKKHFLLFMAMTIGLSVLHASPVDVNKAQQLGAKFVQNNRTFAALADNGMRLAYTYRADNGVATLYVFNLENGFVVMAADDCVRPVMGYSDEGRFNADTAPDGLLFMLDELSQNIASAIARGRKASCDVTLQWDNLEQYGTMHAHRGAPVVEPLILTKWNQDAPYNLYAPAGCPTGCVATAMAQIMKYWEWPLQGTGEHSYICPPYGEQYANFGATTYDWTNMTLTYNNQSTEEEREAVAVLMRHCGVAMDMAYEPSGSGAYSGDLPDAVKSYFSYSDHTEHIARAHTADDWAALLKSNINQNIPIYYSGQSTSGGHAFICDGYDEDGLFHFNWGWGGASNGYFDIEGDKFEYSGSQAIIYDFVPDYLFAQMPAAPESFEIEIDGDVSLVAHLSWVNPTATVMGEPMTDFDKILVRRNGKVVAELQGVPGQAMTFDDEVPFFDQFEYSICAVKNELFGREVQASAVFGPYCEWTVLMTSADFHGWCGGGITVQNAAGTYIDFLTTTTSSAQMQRFQMALGNNNLYWTEPESNISNLTFKVKDSQNQVVYEYSGPSSGLEAGLLRTLNNSCGNENTCETPFNLTASVDPENHRNVHLVWESNHQPEFGYCIYRDGYLFNMSHVTEYVDYDTEIGGHCYYVTALCAGGETENSNEYCVTSGDGCDAPLDLYYQYLSSGKVQIHWNAPENENVKGYTVWRKTLDTPYKRVKLATSTNYKDNGVQEGVVYHYAVTATYAVPEECTSGYANDLFVPTQFFLEVDWNAQVGQLSAKAGSDAVTLTWQPVFGVSTYTVLRDGQELAVVDYACRYVDEDVTTGETYCYKVLVDGNSTNEVCVSIGGTPCAAPTNLAGCFKDNVPHITWTAPEGPEPYYYKMTRIDHLAGDLTEEFQLAHPFFDDFNLQEGGIERSYSVQAVYADCESEFAQTIEGNASVYLVNLGVNEMDNSFRIYPNPTEGFVKVETKASQVAVFNVVGQLVEEKDTENDVVVFDLCRFNSGIYFIKAGNAIQKVVKM